uniref:CSON012303 protein n=1 Tax=Culicoides sonorensis TaxID=179676 RepID=A0A336N228_CULSO
MKLVVVLMFLILAVTFAQQQQQSTTSMRFYSKNSIIKIVNPKSIIQKSPILGKPDPQFTGTVCIPDDPKGTIDILNPDYFPIFPRWRRFTSDKLIKTDQPSEKFQ